MIGKPFSPLEGSARKLANDIRQCPVDIVEHVEFANHLICRVVRVVVQPDPAGFGLEGTLGRW